VAISLQSAYEQVLADLQKRLDQAKEDMARAGERVRSLQAAVRETEDLLKSMAKGQPVGSTPAPSTLAPYAGLRVVEASEAFLKSYGQFADCNTIAEALVNGGFPTRSAKFVRNVLAMLHRDWKDNPHTALARDNQKRWGLKAWLDDRGSGDSERPTTTLIR
jgi:hypothetical protein